MHRSRCKYLTNVYTVRKYSEDYFKVSIRKCMLNPGYEHIEVRRDVNDVRLNNNLLRAKATVFEYAYCNDFDYFITLTLDSSKKNRHDLDKYIKDFGQFIRDYRKKHSCDIQYLLIPERHSDGAWHMHGLIKGIPCEQLQINEHGYLDWYDYRERFGWVSLSRVRSREGVSKYITKYITKDMRDRKKNKKLYYVTRGLKRAKVIKKGTFFAQNMPECEDYYENDYIITFTVRSSTLVDLL